MQQTIMAVPIIFPLMLQIVINVRILSYWRMRGEQNTIICRFCDLGVRVCSTKILVFADERFVIELIRFTAV